MTPPSPPNFTVRHFWPRPEGEPAPIDATFPCGQTAAPAVLYVNTPGEVTCRRCRRSHLVQGLALRGRSRVVLDVDGLELWGLLRFRR